MQTTATSELIQARRAPTPISLSSLWDAVTTRMSKARCRMFHRDISLPVKGKYRCWKCMHEFDANW